MALSYGSSGYLHTPQQKTREIGREIDHDRPQFYQLARQLELPAAERRWRAWVSDYASAHYLRRFLAQVLYDGDLPAAGICDLPIANTRDINKQPEHVAAVRAHLGAQELRGSSVLVITDCMDRGVSMRQLLAPLQAAGVRRVDVASLVITRAVNTYRRLPFAELYIGQAHGVGPRIQNGYLSRLTGYETALGIAVPTSQTNPDDAAAQALACQAFDQLAIDYRANSQAS